MRSLLLIPFALALRQVSAGQPAPSSAAPDSQWQDWTTTVYKEYTKTEYQYKTSVSVSISVVTNYVTVPGPTVTVPGPTTTSTVYVSQAPSIVTQTVTVTNVVPTVSVSIVPSVATVSALVTVTSVRTVSNVQTVTQSALSGLVTCESRIVNPTYTPPAPLPSNYLWGCPPGKLCYPPRIGCNFEQGDPAPGYVCKPEDCRPVAALPPRDVYLAANRYQNNGTCAFITPIDDYFNLNPLRFGLNYNIFNIYGQSTCTTTSTCPPAKTVTIKNDVTIPQTIPVPTTLTVAKTVSVDKPYPVTVVPEKVSSTSTWGAWQGPGQPPQVTKRAVLEKRQLAPLIAFEPCYVSCQYANAAWQSIGNNFNDLCPGDSAYRAAYDIALQCNAEYNGGQGAGALSSRIVTELDEPRGICNQGNVRRRWARDVPW